MNTRNLFRNLFIFAIVGLVGASGDANAQDKDDKDPPQPQISKLRSLRAIDDEESIPTIRLRDTLVVSVSHLDQLEGDIVLYFDGNPVPIEPAHRHGDGALAFELDNSRTEEAGKYWKRMFSNPTTWEKPIFVTIGTSKGGEIKQDATSEKRKPKISFVVIHKYSLWIWIGLMAGLLVTLCYLAIHKNMLREWGSQLVNSGKGNRYSLGRWQMAFWFYFVVGAFSFIWMVTDLTGTITSSMVILMGISSTTAIFAAMVDSTKKAAG